MRTHTDKRAPGVSKEVKTKVWIDDQGEERVHRSNNYTIILIVSLSVTNNGVVL